MRVPIPFATQSYKNASLAVSAQDLVNFYMEKEPPDAKSQAPIFGVPGLSAFVTVGTGPIRGLHVMNNVLYVVSGQFLYSVQSPVQVTQLGGGVIGESFVPMSDNGIQIILMADGELGFVYNAQTSVFSQITDANFFPSNTVTFFDEYFLLVKNGTNEWFFSNILDGTTYNALDFESATVEPSFCLAIVNQQENALVFKQRSIETWYDTGTNDNPWARIDGATIERGCAASLTPIKEDNSVFFLGDDLVFYRLNGVLLQRVSTHAIEAHWQKYATVSDAFCFSYTWNGHKNVVVTFPTGNETWVYDISSGLWHRRVSYTSGSTSQGRWGGNCAVEWLGVVLIGDNFSGNIGELSGSVYTEFGNPIIGTAVAPPLAKQRKRLFQALLELDMQTGVGVATGQGSDPQIALDWSDDNGQTWKAFQPWQSMGKMGAYLTRVRWKKLGSFWQRYYRITVSDPVPRVIMGAYGNMSEGLDN
jgi:hypothetical protein